MTIITTTEPETAYVRALLVLLEAAGPGELNWTSEGRGTRTVWRIAAMGEALHRVSAAIDAVRLGAPS